MFEGILFYLSSVLPLSLKFIADDAVIKKILPIYLDINSYIPHLKGKDLRKLM